MAEVALGTPTTMKAWLFSSTAGGLEKNLKLSSSAQMPTSANSLGKDQILVQVLSTSLNPVDYKIAEFGLLSRVFISKPSSPGLDYAGKVIATGPNSGQVSKEVLKPGQLVFGRLDNPQQFGALGEYIITKRAGTVPLPEGVKEEDASCIGTAGLTAYQSIVPFVKKGDSVFINGGSGGTGVWGIQIAKAKDCYVATTCSAANVELCKMLGADWVIDYKELDVVDELKRSGQQFDLIVDNIGNLPGLYFEMQHYTKPQATFGQVGTEVSFAGTADMLKRLLLPAFLGGGKRKFSFVMVTTKLDDFEQIAKWMQEGKVKAVIDEVFFYKDAPKAFEKLRTGRAKGKIVIRAD